jgi:hypothetical protein
VLSPFSAPAASCILRFQDLLDNLLDQWPQEVLLSGHQLFPVGPFCAILFFGSSSPFLSLRCWRNVEMLKG